MQNTRRHHLKSRGGCRICKGKKIKCDETKPACQYCSLRSLNCVYPEPNITSLASSINRKSAPAQSNHVSPSATSTSRPVSAVPSPSTSTIATCSSTQQFATSIQWSLLDLELLHFYTAHTCLTFGTTTDRQHTWRNVIPQIAFSHHFILHGILGLAALHLSTLHPERRTFLRTAASSYHTKALPMFRAALDDIDLHNYEACAIFGMLIAIFEWASSESASELFFTSSSDRIEQGQSTWVALLRGSGRIIEKFYQEILQSSLACVLSMSLDFEAEARANPAEPAKFSALRTLWQSTESDSIVLDTIDVATLEEAVEWLQILYTAMSFSAHDLNHGSLALTWLCRVSEHYFTMLNARQPVALVLLGHLCLLLNRVEDFWWIKGMSRGLLQEIHNILGEEWVEALTWPMQDLVHCEFKQQSFQK